MSAFQKQSMSVNVRMTPAQHLRIQAEANRRGLSMKEYMLSAVLIHIDEHSEDLEPEAEVSSMHGNDQPQ